MMSFRKILLLGIVLFPASLAAQFLQGLNENPVLKAYRQQHPVRLKSAAVTTLSLPFFEDFSTSAVVPDPAKWADEYAFINSSFAYEPVSVGVATLDAIDENGDVYAITSQPVVSDVLTSQPFNLSAYTYPANTVRLSFFYQAGGKGEAPEHADSLLLDFYNPTDASWSSFWFAISDTVTPFQQVILEVPGSYYQNGFRFRFRNYTSLSVSDVAGGKGALSNADCWNIDYIMMNTNPVSSHTSINDITIVDPPVHLMDFYESVPWTHLNEAQSITRNIMHYILRNLSQVDSMNVGRSYYTRYLQTGITEYFDKNFNKVGPNSLDRRNDPFFAPFVRSDDSKEGDIEVGGFLVTPAGQYKANDTSRIVLRFRDYYAFDDGTPEYGFGIAGPSTSGALLACRFRIFTPDTLRAVDMLFNKTLDNFNADLPFHLCVWDDDGGKPGSLLYFSRETFTPGNEEEMPGFRRYAIDPETDLLITDTVVYVGWQQNTEEFLNLGYDVNRNSLDRTYVNVSGPWFHPNPGNIPGSVMIRAVFGGKEVITHAEELNENKDDILVFPNPVSGMLHINKGQVNIRQISFYDPVGRLVLQPDNNVENIDVSALSPGVYQVVVLTDENRRIMRKIVVSR